MKTFDSKELLKNQLEQINQGNKKIQPVEPAKSAGISYNAELQKMVKAIKREIDKSIVPHIRYLAPEYTADGWFDVIQGVLGALREKLSGDAFNRFANQLASTFVTSANSENLKKNNQNLSKFGIVAYDDPAIDELLKASAHDNARLIKSIQSQYLDQVESIVYANMRAGKRPGAVVEELQKQFGITQNRAKFIARDQTSKINSQLSQKRMQSAGFVYFKWVDSGDFPRVRVRHHQIAEKVTAYGKGIYRYDNPPLSDKGVPILPGEDYGCRCIAQSVLPSEVEKNQREGKVKKGVYR